MKRLTKACKNDILKDGEKHAKTIENMIGNEIKAQGISQILHGFSPKNHSVKCLRVLHTMILAMLRIQNRKNLLPKRHRTEFSV